MPPFGNPEHCWNVPRIAARHRLTEAAFLLMTEVGAHGVTSRAVGDLSGLKASGVNYHFGGSEGLLTATFRLAHERASAWRDRWMPDPAADLPGQAFPGWLALALDDYAFSEAAVRAVLRELGLDVARSSLRQALALAESEAAETFWARVLMAFGLPQDCGGLLADFADGLSALHDHRPKLTEHRAWFSETCSRFSSRITGSPVLAGWDGWRQGIRSRMKAAPNHLQADGLASGAIAILGRHGLGGLTHRAVAMEAGVSLAAVTGAFPTRAALVRGAFDALLAELLGQVPLESLSEGPVSEEAISSGLAASAFTPEGAPSLTMLAIVEFLGAAGRDEQLQEGLLAARTARGETSNRLLSALPSRQPLDSLDAHIFSVMNFGSIRAAFARERSARRAWLEERISYQCRWLTGSGG